MNITLSLRASGLVLAAGLLSACTGSISGESPGQAGGGAQGPGGAGQSGATTTGGQAGTATTGGQAGQAAGGQAGTAGTGPGGAAGDAGAAGAGACDVWAMFAESTCVNCHNNENPSAALNLLDPPSATEFFLHGTSLGSPCSEPYVNANDPGNSLLLRMVDVGGYKASETCAPLMPPVGQPYNGLNTKERQCLADWIASNATKPEPPPEVAPSDPLTYARKVKTLVNGGAVTQNELKTLKSDPTALRAMIAGWMDETWDFGDKSGPYATLFEAKLGKLLMREFQQTIVGGQAQFATRYSLGEGGHKLTEPRLLANLEESSERTLLELVRTGRPLTDAATTDEWYVTSAQLAYLTYFEQNEAERETTFRVLLQQPGYYFDSANVKTVNGDKVISQVIDGVEYLDSMQQVRSGLTKAGLKDTTVSLATSLDSHNWLWSDVSSDTIIVPVNPPGKPPGQGRPDNDGPDDNLSRCRRGDFQKLGYMSLTSREMLEIMFGKIFCGGTTDKNANDNKTKLVKAADFGDWRKVRFTTGTGTPRFYDMATLRAVSAGATLPLRRPHRGFFTTEAFFANTITNVDNSFRVTTNQALIAALGATITEADPTKTVSEVGLSQEHFTSEHCSNCHRLLDPMRSLFAYNFDPNYFPREPAATEDGAFAFLGKTFAEAGITGAEAFGQGIADHPRFARAWVQKMCRYANSRDCDEQDPLFVKIASDFETSKFNLREMVLDLLSSPLVTHAALTSSDALVAPSTSIVRREHFCFALQNRLGQDVCALPSMRSLIETVPNDTIARGAPRVQQATQDGALYSKTMDLVCEQAALALITNKSTYFFKEGSEPDFETLITGLLGMPTNAPRYSEVLDALSKHYADARTSTDNTCNASSKDLCAARSTFVTACVSPDLLGLGF